MESKQIPFWKIAFWIILLVIIIIVFLDLPSSSNDASSSLNNTNHLIPKDIRLKFDGERYVMDTSKQEKYSDPKTIRSLGSKLACDSLNELLGQKIKCDYKVPGTKSPNTGDPISVDCYESTLRVAIDYHPESFYEYDGIDRSNIDVYEFYDRLYLNEIKKEQLEILKNRYIEIPYTIDMCEKVGTEVRCHEYVAPKIRKTQPRSLEMNVKPQNFPWLFFAFCHLDYICRPQRG